jgi:hypothetical protein
MPAVRPVEIPAPSTWSRVLRRYDRDPRLPFVFAGYDCRVTAKPIEVNGVIAPTLFFPLGKEEGAKRAVRLGWIDETDKVRAFASQFVVITGPALADFLDTIEWHALRKLGKSVGVVGQYDRPKYVNLIVEALDKRGGVRPVDVLSGSLDGESPDTTE